jgi:membrane-bound inhibitor of C-type lysozyme
MTLRIWGTGLLLIGCTHQERPPAQAATSEPGDDIEVHDAFSCESGEQLATDYDADSGRLTLSMGDNVARLERVASASGAKFSDGHITFWSHGKDAMLQMAEDSAQLQCHRVLER